MSFPQRKSPRLKGYDYRQEGAYFVTICTIQRTYLFGDIVDGAMQLISLGRIAHEELAHIAERWTTVDVDLFVVMPNHVHVIVVLGGVSAADDVGTRRIASAEPPSSDNVGTPFLVSADPTPSDGKNAGPTLGHVIGNYKAGVTRLARQQNLLDDTSGIWQGRYHDVIIRNESSLNMFRAYTQQNPARWQEDKFYTNV